MSGWATRIHEEEEKKKQHAETYHFEAEPATHQQQPTHHLNPEHSLHLGETPDSDLAHSHLRESHLLDPAHSQHLGETHHSDPAHSQHLGEKHYSFVVENPGLPLHVGMFS